MDIDLDDMEGWLDGPPDPPLEVFARGLEQAVMGILQGEEDKPLALHALAIEFGELIALYSLESDARPLGPKGQPLRGKLVTVGPDNYLVADGQATFIPF